MALMNLKCFQVYTSRVHTCRLLLTGRRVINRFGPEMGLLCRYGSSGLQTACSVTTLQGVACRNYHTELGNPPSSIMGGVNLHGEAGNRFKSSTKQIEEQEFLDELNNCLSYKDIFKWVSSLESLADTTVAAVFQRLCDVEVEDGRLKEAQELAEDEIFRSLCFQLEQESPNLSNSGLVNSLNALIKLRVDPWSTLMVRLISESQERLDKVQMTIKDLCVLAEGLFDLEGPGCAMLEQIMDQVQSTNLEDWRPDEMAMVYRVLQLGVGKRRQYQDLLNKMNNLTVIKVPELNPKLTSTVLNALVVLDQTQAIPLVIKLCKYSIRHVPCFTDDEIVHVLEAFIHFGHNDPFFTEALERHVAKCAFTMHPKAVSKVMQYCGRKHILSKTIFNAVAESFIYNADSFTTVQIAEQIVPFGKLNYLPPCAPSLFRKLERVLSARFTQFQPHVLLNLLHSFTLVERYPLNFLAKVFNPYFLQQLQAEEPGLTRSVCSQLTQLFLTVAVECPSYKGPKLLPRYRVKSFLKPGRSLESSVDVHLYNQVKAGLIDLLGARIYFASHVLSPYYYTIDIEIKLDEEGFVLPATQYDEVIQRIALCVDDRKRFCINSHHLLGKEAIKKRHLKLLGYEVVQIPFFEFELLNNKSDIVKYLHKKIFPNSYRLSW
ncbi:FAST kinase domain-containing protein 3, mitochondrial [Eublepharis macularius]|uniref:FAST kinase domain-containing protein 3, mitochondrial n=1 Tax=Eublepharis macularius TaxID=481883 RepID=A0AA97L439_EUBMA|nr:FAST kinase domain-containing protein 3, mitochondrial [Eublepharis macularius]XP_054841308.1 FAST kinase domain-containing protein 3, mitochondrial [Eublepharis macularius]